MEANTMSHHSHHDHPIGPPPPPTAGRIPGNQFGALVGVLDHLTLAAHDGQHADDNHVYIWIRVPQGQFAGKYECAFNTESSGGGNVESQFLVKEEQIQESDFPDFGFDTATVSYNGLGLTQSEFQPISNGSLRTSVYDWANKAALITAYGVTYNTGDGIHEVHMNSGEPPGSGFSNLVNEDGAMVFYYRPAGEPPLRRWVFIKFSSQTL
jgi:hypothetical protein